MGPRNLEVAQRIREKQEANDAVLSKPPRVPPFQHPKDEKVAQRIKERQQALRQAPSDFS